MDAIRFRTVVELGGKTATGLPVPAEVVQALGPGKRVAVRVTVGGHTYRSTVSPRGEQFLVPLSADNRERAGVAAGDEVEVALEVDDAPRELAVPPDLQSALDTDGQAAQAFAELSYSARQRHVLSVEGAKTDATRQRRVAKVVTDLS